MRVLGVLGASIVAMTALLTLGTIDAPSAGAWSSGPCPTALGVTIVVDFQNLGGGIQVRCAIGSVDTGFQALDRAGFSWTPTARFPGFLCRIDGVPAEDPCQTTPPTTRYWSYWNATRGGAWCYGNFGAGNRTPPAGTVEGWSFSLDRGTSSAPEPRTPPPAAVPGSPTSMSDSTCARSPTATTSPSTQPSTAPGVTPRPGWQGPPVAAATPAPTPSAPGGAVAGVTTLGGTADRNGANGSGQTIGGASDGTTSNQAEAPAPGAGDATSDGTDGATTTAPDASSHGSTPASRDEVAAERRSPTDPAGGSPFGLIAAIVLVGAITATSVVVRRRATTPAE